MLTVSILGLGSRGQMFANLLNGIEDVKLVAIADINETNRNAIKSKYDKNECTIYNGADEFFAKGKLRDALLLCTQDKEHAEMVLKALDLGYDILLEKPAATSIDDCIAIRDKADAAGCKVMLTHVLRYSPYETFRKYRRGLAQRKYLRERKKSINVNELFNKDKISLGGGHGGGDYYLLKDFIDYVTVNSPSATRTTIRDSIENHVIGFKAEESRLNGGVCIKL